MDRRDVKRLTEIFRRLGARDPEGWAESEVSEGIPQLARFLFLRQARSRVVQEADSSWIDGEIKEAERKPGGPYAGVGLSLKALRARGATDQEIVDVVRGMQATVLFGLCYLLEDPGRLDEEAADIRWGLFLLDADGKPTEPLTGLHESVLDTDPTEREMRPR